MSKSFNPIQEGKSEGDLTKRILRGISDVVRTLDDVRGRAQAISDLFLPAVEVQRSKLHDLSYRLLLIDPQGYGKRGEETLWKKGYHDVFITAKRLRKGDNWDEEESSLVRGFLLSGTGHYQHLIFRLQADYALHIEGILDFSMTVVDHGLMKGNNTIGRQEEAPWADALVGRCLLYLGDLARYMRELEPGWDVGLAERLYLQAAWLDGTQGRPHNQLGTLAAGRNHSLDAVYHYMRSLCCSDAFQGAAGNLCKVLEKNASALELEPFGPVPASPARRAVSRFLVVVDAWYWGKNLDNIHLLCPEVVEGFQQVLRCRAPAHHPEHTQPDWENPFLPSPDPADRLPLDALLKVFGILFMCWEKLSSSELSQQSMVPAMLLAMLDPVLQHLTTRCEGSAKVKKRRTKHRRRRRGSDASSGSDLSGEDSVGEVESPEVSSGEEEEITNGHANGLNGKSESKQPTWLGDELMAVLYISCSWLRYHGDILSGCPTSVKPILNNLVTVLNAISAFIAGDTKFSCLGAQKMPTVADAQLRGAPGLEMGQAVLDWSANGRQLSKQEEAALRAYRLLELGQHLPGLSVNAVTKQFQLLEERETPPTVEAPTEECKGKLMKNMGQLWLKAEVKELESRIRKAPGDFSPYLVVDADALVEHIALIKQLVGSRQFIVVIPAVVLAQLDECKRDSGRARETIRWLESQFQHGNRHLRSQKAQERTSLGLIKYPKKKDKEAWNFFQMMECCSYLSKQSELRCKSAGKVTFLTGAKDKDGATSADPAAPSAPAAHFSPSGLASTVGVTLEHVETFHSKWKVSSKSHG